MATFNCLAHPSRLPASPHLLCSPTPSPAAAHLHRSLPSPLPTLTAPFPIHPLRPGTPLSLVRPSWPLAARPWPLGCMMMTLHKLSAGSGYEYLTDQVAALDSTEKGATPLADYYAAKGEAPGRWVGSGLVGLDGIEPGDVVTAEQMKACSGRARTRSRASRSGRRTRSTATRASTGSTPRSQRRGFDKLNHRREAARRRDRPDPVRGRAGVVRPGARSRAGLGARAVRRAGSLLPAAADRGRRVRPDVQPGEVGLGAVGGRPARGRHADRAGARRCGRRRARLPRAGGDLHPRGRRAVPGRSRPAG